MKLSVNYSLYNHFFFFIALVSVSEEVRSRCHIRHSLNKNNTESGSTDFLDSLVSHVTVRNIYICNKFFYYI